VALWTELLEKRPETVHVTPDRPEDVNDHRAAARDVARGLKMRVRTSVLGDGRVAVRWLDFKQTPERSLDDAIEAWIERQNLRELFNHPEVQDALRKVVSRGRADPSRRSADPAPPPSPDPRPGT
jgi:phytoene dehydrogenase-like protein